ncbi:MAG: hypothetical protein K6G26_03395 [Lachnospiraceae bacterium]|nr:hypothetical protein [Lachnospiraceae bacterium]
MHCDFKKIQKNKAISNSTGIKIWMFLAYGICSVVVLFSLVLNNVDISIISTVLIGVTGLTTFIGIIALMRINKFKNYYIVYKRSERIVYSTKDGNKRNAQLNSVKIKNSLELTKEDKKNIDINAKSNKKGYDMFNDLFIKRHKKILMKPAIIETVIILIIAIGIIIMAVLDGLNKDDANIVLLFIPKIIFIMYAINVGKDSTQAMFLNCDQAMLNLRFYKQPKVIASLFGRRLKSIILINLLPAATITLGFEVFLALCGTTDIMYYIIVGLSPIVLSIFFSTHNVVLYYLCQPYDSEMSVKDPKFKFIQGFTYLVSYMIMTNMAKASMMFVAGTFIFMIAYIIIALVLAYYIAPKTFKLRK